MGLELGTLSGRLEIDAQPMRKGLDEAIGALQRFAREAEGEGRKAGTQHGKAVGDGIEREAVPAAKRAGDQVGKAVADGAAPGARKAGKDAGKAIEDGVVPGAKSAGRKAGKAVGDGAAPESRKAGKRAGDEFEAGFNPAGLATKLGGALAGLGIGAGIVKAAKVGLDTAAANEQAAISFETMLGSAKKADSFLKDLRRFAADTPFDMPGLQTAASSLVSIGIDADKVIPIMTTLGDVTSGMGTGAEGIQRATTALQQMNAAQKISGQDLNQLRDAGIPVYNLLAAALGKTKDEVAELAGKGKLGKDALDAMMGALESGKGLERFTGLMEKQSHSLTGIISTIQEEVEQGLAGVIAPYLPEIKAGLLILADLLGGVFGALRDVGAWVEENKGWLTPLTLGILGMAAGWGAYALVTQGIPAGLAILRGALLAVNAAMAANPIGLVIALIAGLVAAFMWAYENVDWFRDGVDEALGMVQGAAAAVGNWFTTDFVGFFVRAGEWIGAQFDGIGKWWDGTVKGVTDAGKRVGDFFTIDIPGFFARSAIAIGQAFKDVKDFLLSPIRGAIEWINNNFVSGINGFLGTIGISWKLPRIPGFAGGGYTGPGGKYDPAGIVHAGEVVWSQDDVDAWGGPQAVDQMRRLRGERVDAITGDHTGDLLTGYAGGGIVANRTQGFRGYDPAALAAMRAWAAATGMTWYMTGIGGARDYATQLAAYQKYLRGQGPLAANPARGGPHMYPAVAMDLSPRPGQVPHARALMAQFGLGLPVRGEPWHLQYLRGRRGGMTAGQGGGAIESLIQMSVDGLLKLMPGFTDPWGEVAKVVLGKVGGGLGAKALEVLGYDEGGWLMPGKTVVDNRTGRPEPVLNPEQWDALTRAKDGDVYNIEVHNPVPERSARSITRALAAAAYLGLGGDD